LAGLRAYVTGPRGNRVTGGSITGQLCPIDPLWCWCADRIGVHGRSSQPCNGLTQSKFGLVGQVMRLPQRQVAGHRQPNFGVEVVPDPPQPYSADPRTTRRS
jgi:hypothetical protein